MSFSICVCSTCRSNFVASIVPTRSMRRCMRMKRARLSTTIHTIPATLFGFLTLLTMPSTSSPALILSRNPSIIPPLRDSPVAFPPPPPSETAARDDAGVEEEACVLFWGVAGALLMARSRSNAAFSWRSCSSSRRCWWITWCLHS